MSVWLPGATVDPGFNGGYTNGKNRMQFAVEHFTVGVNSYGIGKAGYFHMLFPKVGPPWQFAEIDALTWHAGPWNPNGPGAEWERLGYQEELTSDQIEWGSRYHHWLHDSWGVPLDLYSGPRFGAGSWRGFVNHGDLDDQRSDGVTQAEFDAMTIHPPAISMLGEDVYILVSPDESQWVVVGDSQVDGYVKEQFTNLDKVVQVKARTQAEFDDTLKKRAPRPSAPPVSGQGGVPVGYKGTIDLTPKV